MPVITEYNQVKGIYAEAAARGVALPAFCAEDRETLEAILAAAHELGQELGVPDLPVVPSLTGRYPARGQALLMAACGDARLGVELFLSDLDVFTGPSSPYRRLRVLPHLDHAFPWLDGDLLQDFADRFASVMCDASERPFEDNIRLTAAYVDKVRGQVVVEGGVAELAEAADEGRRSDLTTVEQAIRFVHETGVDMIVPNVGTEHRSTGEPVCYDALRARELSAAVGKILCLHGTSSVHADDLPSLPADGFVKVNVFTTLAVTGGQAVARQVVSSLGRILEREELEALVQEGVLGPAAVASAEGPRLAALANAARRDAWFGAVKARCREFFDALGYARYACCNAPATPCTD